MTMWKKMTLWHSILFREESKLPRQTIKSKFVPTFFSFSLKDLVMNKNEYTVKKATCSVSAFQIRRDVWHDLAWPRFLLLKKQRTKGVKPLAVELSCPNSCLLMERTESEDWDRGGFGCWLCDLRQSLPNFSGAVFPHQW